MTGTRNVSFRWALVWVATLLGARSAMAQATGQTSRPASMPTTTSTTNPATNPADVARLVEMGSRGVRLHDPSTIVRAGDRYHLFATGQGIVSYSSPDLKTWTRGRNVFERPLDWFAEVVPGNRGHLWAPDVIRADDAEGERWLLYYSISTFGKNTSAIALVTNRTLDPASPTYRWTDAGVVVRSARGDRFNAIDPAVTRDAEGRFWMSFGSFWGGIQLIELDETTGLRKGGEQTILAYTKEIEAPFIYARGGAYYQFVNWGICCRGVKSTYEIRVGRSDTITGPYVDREGKPMIEGGGTAVLASDGPMIGPGHAGIVRDAEGREQFSFHFYDATDGGRSKLAIRELTWDAEGWPSVRQADVAK